MTGGRCENNLMQLTLKSDCCCSIGLAWGSPCEPCKPEDCGGECNKGFVVKYFDYILAVIIIIIRIMTGFFFQVRG